jgi:hypothetical protein
VDWGTLAGMAGLLTLQSAAFGMMLSWLRSDVNNLRTELHAGLADLRDYSDRIGRLE